MDKLIALLLGIGIGVLVNASASPKKTLIYIPKRYDPEQKGDRPVIH